MSCQCSFQYKAGTTANDGEAYCHISYGHHGHWGAPNPTDDGNATRRYVVVQIHERGFRPLFQDSQGLG